MLYFSKDEVIGRSLELYGEFSESENRTMLPFIKPGDVVLDVGANVGTVTLPFAHRVGPQGRVYAFEPQRIVFQHLCANIALNGLFNVDARCAAVGAATGVAHILDVSPDRIKNAGAARISHETGDAAVPLIKLDDLDLPRCSLIKIDVEGMEAQVLAGADNLVERHQPIVYFEAKPGDNTRACLVWLIARSYSLYWHFSAFFEPHNFRKHTENVFGSIGDVNVLALPRDCDLKVILPKVSGPDADWKAELRAWFHVQPRAASKP